MKKILIVDDEYLVRLGLKTTIDWAEHGYSIAGEASNGKEALEIFDRIGADVILTDIKMPVMDGLEFIKAIKNKNRQIPVVILSHYEEFAYAQEAMRLGAFRYILKSELTKTNLIDLLESLVYASHSDREENNSGDIMKRQGDYIKNYLYPYFSDTTGELPAIPIPDSELFPRKEYIVLSGSCKTIEIVSDAKKMLPKTVKVLISESCKDCIVFGDYHRNQYQIIAIIPVSVSSAGTVKKIKDSCLFIVKNMRQYYNINMLIGLSSPGRITDIQRLMKESQRAFKMCFFSERNFVNEYNQDEMGIEGKPLRISYAKLSEMIEQNNKDGMLEYIQNVFRELQTLKDISYVHEAFIDFLSIGKSIREKYIVQEQASLSENKFNYDNFYDIEFIGDMEFYIYGILLALMTGKRGGDVSYSYIVQRSISFIRDNYRQNITLSDAARFAEVSHSYLSFIFKQETGINFNAYLSEYRIEAAKKLLQSTNLRIYEVADRVGFSNPYYFSKVFKEITGISCKDFRNSVS